MICPLFQKGSMKPFGMLFKPIHFFMYSIIDACEFKKVPVSVGLTDNDMIMLLHDEDFDDVAMYLAGANQLMEVY